MKFVKQFENKKVLVLGLAKSGESAARLLDRLGAIVLPLCSMSWVRLLRSMMANLLKKIQQHKVYWKKGLKL